MPLPTDIPTAPIVFRGDAAEGVAPSEITKLMHFALEKGSEVGTMERLFALYERVTDRQAAIEFAGALSAFQERCPILDRKTEKKITTEGGGSYTIRYADLGQIAREIAPILKDCGLSYTWNTTVDATGKMVTVACILRHVNGHRENAEFSCPPTGTKAMSDPQKFASATTYAKRQSLCQVLGITTADPDTDGMDSEPISPAQVKALDAMIAEVGADKSRFLAAMGIQNLAELPMAQLNSAMQALRTKERMQERKK